MLLSGKNHHEVNGNSNANYYRLLLQSFSNIAETLLKNAERYPASPQAITDLELVKPFLGLFEILEIEKACYRSEEVTRIRQSCGELWDRAIEAVRSTNIEFGE